MPVFGNKAGCESFLSVLDRVVDMFGLRVCAYALLPHAFYLVVFSERTNISRAMQFLQAVFTQRYNKAQIHEGPIFKGRFKSTEVAMGSRIEGVIDYVHNLPVEFGLCKKAHDFVWSSKRAQMNALIQDNLRTQESLSSKIILRAIAREYNTSLKRIRMGHRGVHGAARLALVYCLRTLLGMPLEQIARFTHAQNANAVAQTLHRAKEMVETDVRMRGVVERCRRECRSVEV